MIPKDCSVIGVLYHNDFICAMHEEILFIDKPKGITSFDVIRRLRRILGVKKMGHAGTLDPLASGLMIIAIGAATKKLNEFLKLPKVYRADILLGRRTTTGDMEGEILEEKEVPATSREEVEGIAGTMKGIIALPVPAYSAIKVHGKALYKYAREGNSIEMPIKNMEVLWIKVLDWKQDEQESLLSIECEVASGTYIRSLAEELGRRLQTVATLKDLRRIQIGKFRIEDAKTLEELTNENPPG